MATPNSASSRAKTLIILYVSPIIFAYSIGSSFLFRYFPENGYELSLLGLALLALFSFAIGRKIKKTTDNNSSMEQFKSHEIKRNRRRVVIYGLAMLALLIPTLALIAEYSPDDTSKLIGIVLAVALFLFLFFKIVDRFKLD